MLKEVKYSKIFQDLLKHAESGSVEAQYQVAVNYDYGNLIPRDFDKALSWHKKSASNYYKATQFQMGYF